MIKTCKGGQEHSTTMTLLCGMCPPPETSVSLEATVLRLHLYFPAIIETHMLSFGRLRVEAAVKKISKSHTWSGA
jgi:hypothetical protein